MPFRNIVWVELQIRRPNIPYGEMTSAQCYIFSARR